MWALRIPRLGISIILPKNHDMDPEARCLCMDYMVAEHDVARILKMFKGKNKLSNAISYSNCRIVKSEHAYSLRCCLKNTNNIQEFERSHIQNLKDQTLKKSSIIFMLVHISISYLF